MHYIKNKYITFSENYLSSQIKNTKRKILKILDHVLEKTKEKRENNTICNNCLNNIRYECNKAVNT